MARGKIKILSGSFEQVIKKKVSYVARSYRTKKHGKAKSLKNFEGNWSAARAFASGRKNIIITKELR